MGESQRRLYQIMDLSHALELEKLGLVVINHILANTNGMALVEVTARPK